MRIRRRLGALAIVLAIGVPALGVGLGVGAVRAAPAGAVTVCERLAGRVAEVPGIRARIRDQIAALERRLAHIGDPIRRARVTARLEPRLAGLRTLDARLAAQVAEAERRCNPPT